MPVATSSAAVKIVFRMPTNYETRRHCVCISGAHRRLAISITLRAMRFPLTLLATCLPLLPCLRLESEQPRRDQLRRRCAFLGRQVEGLENIKDTLAHPRKTRTDQTQGIRP